jgi:FOG: WD40 repeat
LWDVATGKELRRFGSVETPKHVHDQESPISFSPDGKTITSATIPYEGSISSYVRTFRVWEVATGKEIHAFQDVSQWHGPVAYSPDGKLLATAGGVVRGTAPNIHLWDIERGKALPAIDISQPGRLTILASLTFSPDGKLLASSDGGPIQLWDLATHREAGNSLPRYGSELPRVFSVRPTPDFWQHRYLGAPVGYYGATAEGAVASSKAILRGMPVAVARSGQSGSQKSSTGALDHDRWG